MSCFLNAGRKDLHDIYSSYIKKGMSDHDATMETLNKEYKSIHDDINNQREKIKLNKTQFIPVVQKDEKPVIEKKYNDQIAEAQKQVDKITTVPLPTAKAGTDTGASAPGVSQGKQMFSQPDPKITTIDEEYKNSKGIKESKGDPITKIDVENSKKIADAFEVMVDDPKNPEVIKAYEALVSETLDQYNFLKSKGYKVEIYDGKGEPYANSQEMLKDLRENNHLYVLSTEKEFGNGVTDIQRLNNPLLRDSGVKDINGKTLLNNDVFRFVHDVFGHGERGNSFGPVGEENAWDVHSRMYSPIARRAMTTETRGQNSWVNFGKHLRNKDGSIKKVSPKEKPYAEQKMGLLPEWVSNVLKDVTPVSNDTTKEGSGVGGDVESISNKKLNSKEGEINTGNIKVVKNLPNVNKVIGKDENGNEIKVVINGDKLKGTLLSKNGNYLFKAMQGRVFTLAKVGDFYLPFYISSAGTSGKIAGKWYPFFGYNNWLVKGRVGTKGEMEYSQKISDVQKLLNDNFILPARYLSADNKVAIGEQFVPAKDANGNIIREGKYNFEKMIPNENRKVLYDLSEDIDIITHHHQEQKGETKLNEHDWVAEKTGLNPKNVVNDGGNSADNWINDIIALTENAEQASKGVIKKVEQSLKETPKAETVGGVSDTVNSAEKKTPQTEQQKSVEEHTKIIHESTDAFEKANNANTNYIRTNILEMDEIHAKAIGVEDIIKEAHDRYITAPNDPNGAYHKEKDLVIKTKNGEFLTAPQVVAVANALNQMHLTWEIHEQMRSQQEKMGMDTKNELKILSQLEDDMDHFTAALNKTGTEAARALAIRKELLFNKKMDRSHMRTRFSQQLANYKMDMNEADKQVVDKAAADVEKANKELSNLLSKEQPGQDSLKQFLAKHAISELIKDTKSLSLTDGMNEALTNLDKVLHNKNC